MRTQDAERRRGRVVAVAMRHLVEHGHRGIRVEDIAAEEFTELVRSGIAAR